MKKSGGTKFSGKSSVKSKGAKKLGRGQYTQFPRVNCTVTNSGQQVTIDFDRSVVISGPVNLNISNRPNIVSWTVEDGGAYVANYDRSISGHTWSLAPDVETITTTQGAHTNGGSGTFT